MAYLTDKEYLNRFEYYTAQLEERLLKEEDFKAVCDQIPCPTVISRLEEVDIVYTNKKHSEVTGYSHQEVRENCPKFLKNSIHPVSLKNIRKFLPEFYESQMPHRTFIFLQYAKRIGEKDYAPFITFTKSPKLRNGLVIRLPVLIEDFGPASKKMEQIVEMDQFKMKNFKRFQTLTNRELEILKLLANGHSNSRIAGRLFISRQTVETHRKHIKRKLEIKSYRDLVKYAFAFNIITI